MARAVSRLVANANARLENACASWIDDGEPASMNAVQPAIARSGSLSSQVAASPGSCARRVEATSSAATDRAERRTIPLSILRFQIADFRFQIADCRFAD